MDASTSEEYFAINSSTGNETESLNCQLADSPAAVKGLIGFLTIVIIILGIFGNVLVCLVVIRRPKMRTVINMFICNLAVSDLMFAVLAFPINITQYMSLVWVLPHFLCPISCEVPALTVFVSSLTLTAIAVDRFCLVVYPLLKPINKNRCYIALTAIWIISTALTLPIPINTSVVDFSEIFGQPVILCLELWKSGLARKHYAISLFLIQFCYPLMLVTIAHTCISIKLSRNVRPGMRGRESEYRENCRRQRMNRMLSAVVVVFAVCWSPFNVTLLLQELGVNISCVWHMVSQLIAGSSIIMNPILYAWLNDNFRKEFHRMLPFLTCLEDLIPNVTTKSSTGAVSGCNVNGNPIRMRKEHPTGGTYLQPTAAESTVSSRATPVLNTRKLPIEDTKM